LFSFSEPFSPYNIHHHLLHVYFFLFCKLRKVFLPL
jgi:hypothetical protein